MERFAIRALKFTIYFYVLMSLGMVLMYFMQGGQAISFKIFAEQIGIYRLIIFGLAFGISYPFIGFGKRKVYLNRPFTQERAAIVDILAQFGYEETYTTETSIYFRPTNRLKRLFDQYEDTIEINHHDNPIVVKGLRKRIMRISASMESYILNEKR